MLSGNISMLEFFLTVFLGDTVDLVFCLPCGCNNERAGINKRKRPYILVN
jgi:hypothetical protein